MLSTIKIDGTQYHAQRKLTEDGEAADEYELILDEDGGPNPC